MANSRCNLEFVTNTASRRNSSSLLPPRGGLLQCLLIGFDELQPVVEAGLGGVGEEVGGAVGKFSLQSWFRGHGKGVVAAVAGLAGEGEGAGLWSFSTYFSGKPVKMERLVSGGLSS